MIRYVTPYAIDGNLAKAYNEEMDRAKPGEFICFTDRDVWFPHPHFGHHIARIVAQHGTAFYTAYTNRINCPWQRLAIRGDDATHVEVAHDMYDDWTSEVENHTDSQLWSGHLMICPKDAWTPLPEDRGILGIDNIIHQLARQNGHRILLMKGIYVWHYYSGYDGASNTGNKKRDKRHLL